MLHKAADTAPAEPEEKETSQKKGVLTERKAKGGKGFAARIKEKSAAKKKASGDPPSQAELKKMQAAKDRLEAKSTKVAARPGSHREKLEKDPELYKEVEEAAVKKGKRTVDGFLKGLEEEREEREKTGAAESCGRRAAV